MHSLKLRANMRAKNREHDCRAKQTPQHKKPGVRDQSKQTHLQAVT